MSPACLKSDLMNNIFLGAGARLARYIRNEPVRAWCSMAIQDFDSGSHLLLFPEGTRTTTCPVNPLKGSIGLIAHHAQVPVQTRTDRNRLGVSEQGLDAVPQTADADPLPGAPGTAL